MFGSTGATQSLLKYVSTPHPMGFGDVFCYL